MAVSGIVKEGRIIPDLPLPEGARVQITLVPADTQTPADLQAELDGWDRASANALDLVERLARGEKIDDKR